MPDLDFVSPTSPAPIEPLTATSARKLVASVVWPDFDFTKPTSAAPTLPLPVPAESPMSTPMVTPTSPLFTVVIDTKQRDRDPLRIGHAGKINVTVVVPLPLLVATEPVPLFTAAPLKVTGGQR